MTRIEPAAAPATPVTAAGTGARESRRAAGLLLHPSSLPGPHPIGDLGPAAHALLDWMADAGLSLWQVLPLGPTGFGDSPYGSHSSFAGNPLLVSPEALIADGLLPEANSDTGNAGDPSKADFQVARRSKEELHRKAWQGFSAAGRSRTAGLSASNGMRTDWESFRDDPAVRQWLADWSLFAALKKKHGGRPWLEWDLELRDRKRGALERARRQLADEIEFQAFEQFLFHRQWTALRAAAAARSIRLIGDLPFYPALDSADVWAHRKLFDLSRAGRPKAVAGVPPDYFSASGQLWGNPVFRWDRLAESGFSWWLDQLRWQAGRFDLIRLDHFRGFVAWWRVPARAKSAARGAWTAGPGTALFDAVRDALGDLPLLAEDLGEVDAPVEELRRSLGLPGMRVLQFAFSEEDSSHAPHRHSRDAVVYTGTHDNDTCRGWLESAPEEARHRALTYLGADAGEFPAAMVRAAYTSVADLAVTPLQDLCALGSEARMNTPAQNSGNWSWRVRAEQVTPQLPGRLRDLAAATARLPGR